MRKSERDRIALAKEEVRVRKEAKGREKAKKREPGEPM